MSKPDFSNLSLPFEPGEWCDADERMFQACFAILGQYVEQELGTQSWNPEDPSDLYRGYRLHSADIEEGDPSGIPPQPSTDRKAIDLWLWYQHDLPKIEQEYADDLHRVYGGADVMQFEPVEGSELRRLIINRNGESKFPYDYPEIVKDEKLKELMALRRALWT